MGAIREAFLNGAIRVSRATAPIDSNLFDRAVWMVYRATAIGIEDRHRPVGVGEGMTAVRVKGFDTTVWVSDRPGTVRTIGGDTPIRVCGGVAAIR